MSLTSIEIDDRDTFDLLFASTSTNNDLNPIYVDVGAYNGDTIDRALKINPSLRIIAIEPIKDLCNAMQLKYESNPNITIVNKASSNHQSQIELYEYSGGTKGLSTINPLLTIIRPQTIYTNSIQSHYVQSDTLDNILKSRNIDTVDYIKIDVEGSEHNVLEGFTKYHNHTRFHIESHIINLENILHCLLEMNKNVNIEKIILFKEKISIIKDSILTQTHINNYILGTIIGEFI